MFLSLVINSLLAMPTCDVVDGRIQLEVLCDDATAAYQCTSSGESCDCTENTQYGADCKSFSHNGVTTGFSGSCNFDAPAVASFDAYIGGCCSGKNELGSKSASQFAGNTRAAIIEEAKQECSDNDACVSFEAYPQSGDSPSIWFSSSCTSNEIPALNCGHDLYIKNPDAPASSGSDSSANGSDSSASGSDSSASGSDSSATVPVYEGVITGSSRILSNFDSDNVAKCEAAFGSDSRPAGIADFVQGISGVQNVNGWICVGKGPGGEEVMTATGETGWKNSDGQFVSLKSNGHIRLGIRPNTDLSSMSEPVYSTQPMTVYYGAWGENYDLGDSGFTWGNISRQLAPCKIICVK